MTNTTKLSTAMPSNAVDTNAICAIAAKRLNDAYTYRLLSAKATGILEAIKSSGPAADELIKLLANYNHSELGITDPSMIDWDVVSVTIPEMRNQDSIRQYTQHIRSYNNRGNLTDKQRTLIQEAHELFDDKSFIELSQQERIEKKKKLKLGRLSDGILLNENEKFSDQQIDTLLYYTICGKSWIRMILLGVGLTLGGMYVYNKISSSKPEENKAPEPSERTITKENQEAAPIDTLPKFNTEAFRAAMEDTQDRSFLQIGSHANNFNYGVTVEDKGDRVNFFGRSDYSSLGSFPYSFARGYTLEDVTKDLKLSFEARTSTVEIDVTLPPFKLQDFKAIDSLGWHKEKQTDIRSKFGGTKWLEDLHTNVRNDAKGYLKSTFIPAYVRMNIPQQTLKSIKGIAPWLTLAAKAAVSNGHAKKVIVRVKYPVSPFSPEPMEKQRNCGEDGSIKVHISYKSDINRSKTCSGGYVVQQHVRTKEGESSYNIIDNQLEFGQFND